MHKKLSILVASVAVMLASSGPVVAHHSFAAEFDARRPVKLRGTVTKMEWVNPHSWIHIDVKNPDGSISKWMIEAGAPNSLIRRGWNKSSLPRRHGNPRRGVSGKGRTTAGERPGRHIPGREQIVCRVVRNWCAG